MISCPSELTRMGSVKYFVIEEGFAMYCGYSTDFMLVGTFYQSNPINRRNVHA